MAASKQQPVLTESLARAAGWDAGNRHASRHNRTVWNEEDYNAAAREFNRLWPIPSAKGSNDAADE